MVAFRFVLALLLGPLSLASATPPCPYADVQIWPAGDTTCSGTPITYNDVANWSVPYVQNGFSSVKVTQNLSGANASWQNQCVLAPTVNTPFSADQYDVGITAVLIPINETEASCFSCSNVSYYFVLECYQPEGAPPSTCGIDGIVPPTSIPQPGSSTLPQTTSPTSSSSPTEPPGTTPSPTNTESPNPFVISAIVSVSAALSSVDAAISVYNAQPSNSVLAASALTAVEIAQVKNDLAMDLADDYSASKVLSDLSDLEDILDSAAKAAIAAELGPDVAASDALVNAIDPAAAAVAAAISGAKNPLSDPAPNTSPTTRSSSSSSTSSPGPCTLCVECADAAVSEITPAYSDFSGTATPFPLATAASNPSAATPTASVADSKPTERVDSVLPGQSRYSEADAHPNEFSTADRYATICGFEYQVPGYYGWNAAAGNSNPYQPYYNYYTSTTCAQWDFAFKSSPIIPFSPAPQGFAYASQAYATEHIYEVQQVKSFLAYLYYNEPIFQSYYPTEAKFCQGPGSALASTNQFVASNVYPSSPSPGDIIYSALEGSTTFGGSSAEFVYLESQLNNHKQIFFSGSTPSIYNAYLDNLAIATRTAMLVQYLQDANVAQIYRTVSERVKAQWVRFGDACAQSTYRPYQPFGQTNMSAAYDNWERSYLTTIQTNLQNSVHANLNAARAQIQYELAGRARGTITLARQLQSLDDWIDYVQTIFLTAADLSITQLMPDSG